MAADLDRIGAALGDLAQRNVPIGPLTTYRVGGPASVFCDVASEADLRRVADVLSGAGSDVPLLVIGKGSNLLVADGGWEGVCVHLGEGFSAIDIDGVDVVAGGAVAYPVLARRTAAAGLTGMEWAVGVPGSVGGAVRMNAGGHGAATRDRLVRAHLIDLVTGADRWHSVAELDLSYRHSAVGPGQVVAAAQFRLEAGDARVAAERIAEIVRWRRENQPGGQNAGSVFTNPPGDSAGRLVDEAGLKGFRIGSAAVSDKHANFIQADPAGSADDVRRLVVAVRRAVAERLGVELEVEVQMVGWDPSLERADPPCS
ncbi:MAG: UDP-N-acetylmuramate dehydrogenase [Acidimicrobiales bacterium]|jgi:UDP-N-acetylmuramate dehydrogenase